MKKRIKMVDVARTANVSRTTVSLVLNQIPGVRIAEATRRRVLQVARDLGYSPGPALDAIDPDGSHVYGLLINEISSAYPIDLVYGVQNWAETQGLQILIQVTNGATDREAAALGNFARFGVQGVIYANTFSAVAAPAPGLAQFRHVFLNCKREDGEGFAVLPAERRGGYIATEHLLALGRRRVATITGDPWQMASKERLSGYHRAVNQAARNCGVDYERNSDWSHAGGYAAMQELFDLPEPPDAVFCQNDLIARGAIAAAHDRGLSVPRDLAVVGFDDREFSKDIGLTSVTLPFMAMAERAMTELVGESEPASRTVTVAGTLVARASSGWMETKSF